LGFGVGGFAPNPQSPIPNPQSPIPNPQSPFILNIILYYLIIIINIYIIKNLKEKLIISNNQN
jgi:hypothetical protein